MHISLSTTRANLPYEGMYFESYRKVMVQRATVPY